MAKVEFCTSTSYYDIQEKAKKILKYYTKEDIICVKYAVDKGQHYIMIIVDEK